MSDGTPEKSELRASIDANAKKKKKLLVFGGGAVAVALVAGIVAIAVTSANAPGKEAVAGESETLSITIAGAGDSELQDAITEVGAEKGLEVEWVNFDDWTLPNSALVAGEVDANAFQHIAFLSAFNVANDADLTPVLSTVIVQWGIFSATLDSLDDIADGARIAIPDDASNGARALFILDAAGLITLGDDVGVYPTVDDIEENPRNIELVPIAAITIPTQFDDPSLDAVVVGTSYFEPTQGIDAEDGLFLDDPLASSSLPYVNVIATTADNADNPAWKILAEVYKDERIADANEKDTFGNALLVDVSVDDLRTKLAALEDLARQLGK